MKYKNLLIVFSVIIASNAQKITFDGYKVYKVIPKTNEELELLQNLQKDRILELWDDLYVTNRDVRLMVPPQNVKDFLCAAQKAKMDAKEVINDMQKAIDKQLEPAETIARSNTSFLGYSWERYHTLDQIYKWLDDLVDTYPNIVSNFSIGTSVEGRDIRGIKIDYNPNRRRKVIGVFEGTLHAREWISPAMVTWVIKEFLTSRDPEVRIMAENMEWHMIPVVNPDGYVYTFTTHRMWRKNRSRNSFTSCAASGVSDDMSNGVDLNRNFDFVWMSVGASSNPCTNTYAGPRPFSEPEAWAVANYIRRLQSRGKIIYYLSIHSFTQLFVIPYSHVNGTDVLLANNYADMYEIAIRSAERLERRYGTHYRVGVSADILYKMSGSSFDWVKYYADVPVSYLIELRDLGEYGFLLPPEQIIPNNLEIMDGLLEMDKTTRLLGANYVSYKNYRVYKIVPETDKHVQVLIDLQKQKEFFFWSDIIDLGNKVRIMVAPEKFGDFEEYLTRVGIKTEVIISDVQSVIDDQMKRPSQINRRIQDYAWDYYQTLEEIYDWLEKTVEDHSDVATLVTAGRSVEGRYIRGVKIDIQKKDYPIIGMIEGGIHAREWISPATVTWIIKEFLTSSNEDVRALAENIVWHIFPVINPDGYAYTFTNNRMWRKNRNPANFASCSGWNLDDDMSNGIDLNRNFGFLWMTVGASSEPCAETYAGPVAFSEPESIGIANYVTGLQRQGSLIYYFAFHSYSQMVLVPYSHVAGADVLEAYNYADMYEIAIKGMDKLKAKHGTDYLVGTSKDILYEVSGSSFDWVKGGAHVPIVYLFELRDVGEYGFLLPPHLIVPNNEEIVAALVEMDKVTRSLGYIPSSGSIFRISGVLIFVAALLALLKA
ncbi:uncharacterized protein [Epargyreus clarus]|uniref:uncharacterized protein n=1 Tax=Epargyreus clarus TaxID=520877 RepID=UPI003C2BE009